MDMKSVAGAKYHPAHISAPRPLNGDEFDRLKAEMAAISAGGDPHQLQPGEHYPDGHADAEALEHAAEVVNEIAAVQPSDLERVKATAAGMITNLHEKASAREDQYERDRADLVHMRAARRTEIVQKHRRAMEAVKAGALAELERFDKGDDTVLAIRELDAANQRARDEDDRLQAILRTMKDG